MKKFIAMLLALAMVFALAACGSSSAPAAAPAAEAPAAEAPAAEAAPAAEPAVEPVKLVGYCPGAGVPWDTVKYFSDLVAEKSNGAIVIDVHEAGTLGNDAEAIESTRMGTIDVICAGTSGFTAFYEPAKVLDLPFLFSDAEQACDIMNGPVGEEIFADFSDFGLVYLGEGDNGLRQISTTNRPIHTAADVEGLKIRVPTSQLYLDVWEALGATPVALALNELALALSNGTAEGQDNATYHLVANATYDDIKYFSYINYMWMGTTLAMNSTSWGKLDADQQALLKECAYEAGRYGFDRIKADNASGEATLKEAGVEFDATPDVQSFKDKLDIPAYYDRYENETWFNRDLLNTILEAAK